MALFHVYTGTLHAAAAAVGLTVPQAMLIDRLPAHEPQPMTAIANMLGCDTSNATGLVDRLEHVARGELDHRHHRTDNPLFTDLDAPTCRQLTTQLLRMANHDVTDDVVPIT